MSTIKNIHLDCRILELITEQLGGVAITDKEGRYVYVNESYIKKMGCMSLNNIRGKYVRDIFPDTKIHEVLKNKKKIVGHAIRTLEDDKKYTFVSYIPIFKEGELVAGFIYEMVDGIQKAIEFTQEVKNLTNQYKIHCKQEEKNKGAKYSINNIVGNSECIRQMKDDIRKAARSASTVLIEGETGCGKELVAHAIHDLSPRSRKALVKVNCAAIPNELIESEFFGYDEGAFTGAKKGGKIGKFEMANRGSIFLDEINQMPYNLQPKLLRALQEREIERVGGKEIVHINTRVIAATNYPLEKLIDESKFRSDLFYRLNVITIKIPPLRERKEDISLIADSILEKLNLELGTSIPRISNEAKFKLQNYDWPGNVRELQNVIERAMNMSWGEELKWKHFEKYFEDKVLAGKSKTKKRDAYDMKNMKDNIEREIILNALRESNNNKTSAAKLLGISRTILYRKLRKYEIE